MRRAIFILPLLVLVACATPREACINDAIRDVRILDALIVQTRGNLARGYALEERQDVRTLRRTCRGRNEDGSTFIYRCDEVETFTTTVPVAIDLNAEREKLVSLEERQRQNRINADTAVGQCIAIHPE
ncbi:hypothetical protein [Yoonia sp.]|jgi:hypothetical protein|uniref:hypothetical protein n=1 Tax=Yoonia sp. TaxID=2212373 RepID=UPI0025DD9073|nr:hypothetical protein [Yoonia sp.]